MESSWMRENKNKIGQTKYINFCIKQRDDWFRAPLTIGFSNFENQMHENTLKRHLFFNIYTYTHIDTQIEASYV